jgi:hypothetical protein
METVLLTLFRASIGADRDSYMLLIIGYQPESMLMGQGTDLDVDCALDGSHSLSASTVDKAKFWPSGSITTAATTSSRLSTVSLPTASRMAWRFTTRGVSPAFQGAWPWVRTPGRTGRHGLAERDTGAGPPRSGFSRSANAQARDSTPPLAWGTGAGAGQGP